MLHESNNQNSELSNDESRRYARHLQLTDFGNQGQLKLKRSRVLVIGCGGLGAPVLLYLVAAGVGQITIVDADQIELSNLQRQVLFDDSQIGKDKVQASTEQLNKLNPNTEIRAINQAFTIDNANTLLSDIDLVIDCTDNFATRYLINDRCRQFSIPWIFASIYQYRGQCSMFSPDSSCFRCLFPNAPSQAENCSEAGVLGVLPGMLGVIQATVAIKHLAGLPSGIKNQLLIFDAIEMSTRKIKLKINTDCPVCNVDGSKSTDERTLELIKDYALDKGPFYEINREQTGISPDELKKKFKDYLLIDVRSKQERNTFNIGGTHLSLDKLESAFKDNKGNIRSNIKDYGKPVVCYCQSGIRSIKAAEIMAHYEISAASLIGGLNAWPDAIDV